VLARQPIAQGAATVAAGETPDSLLVGRGDGVVEEWLLPGQRVGGWQAHDAAVVWIERADDHLLTVADNGAAVWSGEKLLARTPATTLLLRQGAFDPAGTSILTVGVPRTPEVWDAKTGRRRLGLEGHTSNVLSGVHGANGALIVTGSMDETLRIWDAASGILLATASLDSEPVFSLAAGPGPDEVAVGLENGALWLWSLAPAAPEPLGCVVPYALSPDLQLTRRTDCARR